jgi:hypothetical protein
MLEGSMKKYIITGGNEVNFIDALEAETMAGAKRQRTKLIASYDCAQIWERTPESEKYRAMLVAIDENGYTTGEMRDIDAFDNLI